MESQYSTPAMPGCRCRLHLRPTYPLHDDSAQRMADEDERPLRGAFDLRRHTAPLAVSILFFPRPKMEHSRIAGRARTPTARSASSCATSVCACCMIRSSEVLPSNAVTLALYPHVRILACGSTLGSMSASLSHETCEAEDVQVLMGSPLRPWTATMLGGACER